MKLVFPSKRHEQQAIEYIQEFYDFQSEIYGAGSLQLFLKEGTYDGWLEKLIADLDIANISAGKVPAITYFYMNSSDADRIIGMINIRLTVNDFLRKEGGHIGYSIRPTERGRSYGTNMLKMALAACKTIDLREIIITCDKNNAASAKVAKNNGGVLEADFYSDFFKSDVLRFKITLT